MHLLAQFLHRFLVVTMSTRRAPVKAIPKGFPRGWEGSLGIQQFSPGRPEESEAKRHQFHPQTMHGQKSGVSRDIEAVERHF